MKGILFIFVGAPKDPAFRALEKTFLTQISHSVPADICYLKDSPEKNPELKRKKESALILEKIKPGDFIVLCDERGKGMSSPEFAKKLKTWQETGKRLVFVVGGAYGIDPLLHDRAHFTLRLSDFVFAHELARTVLLEQVYRGLSILSGSRYHHE